MSRKTVIWGIVIVIVLVGLVAAGFFIGQPLGLAAAQRGTFGYGFAPHQRMMALGRMPFLFGGLLFGALTRLGVWLLQIALTAWLVTWFLKRGTPAQPPSGNPPPAQQ